MKTSEYIARLLGVLPEQVGSICLELNDNAIKWETADNLEFVRAEVRAVTTIEVASNSSLVFPDKSPFMVITSIRQDMDRLGRRSFYRYDLRALWLQSLETRELINTFLEEY